MKSTQLEEPGTDAKAAADSVTYLFANGSLQQAQKTRKVFISYSTDDLHFVKELAKHIEPLAEVRYWDKSKEPGQEAWTQIFTWIDESDTVLAVITDKTVIRAMSVGQEIGRAKAKGKTVVPLVAEGISASVLGCLSGITYEPIAKDNPAPAFERIRDLFRRKQRESDAGSESENSSAWSLGTLILVLGVAALVWVLFFKKK